jgi:digeranylgeranylglycerophospholipid reductase
MMRYDVDVAVVGAGPAGSIAAWELAKNGIKVMVLEKRQEIGAPKRCAEGLNANALKNMGIKPDRRWVAQEINGAYLYAPTGEIAVSLDEKLNLVGYVLERKMFEKFLATEAIKAGARYMVKTMVTDVIKDGSGRVTGVKADYMGEDITVNSKIVIAADGVDSMTAKRAGINTVNRLGDYHSGFQYEMAGVNADQTKLHIFFGNDISPKGYVWIFPKGNTTANVGIGIVGLRSEDGSRAKDLLDRFIANNPKFFAKASPIEVNGGGIPVNVTVDTFVGDGIMLVGDAAQQVNPMHGGGISLAMNSARLAAKVAREALADGDTSRERLLSYESQWNETDGAKMKRLLKLRSFVEKLDDAELNSLGGILGGDDILKLMSSDTMSLLKLLARKAPKLLPLAKKFLE